MPVDVERVAFAMREYRSIISEDLAVQAQHPLSVELEFNTFISTQAAAQTFADEVLSLRKLDRDTWTLLVNRQNYQVELGDTITVFFPRFGLSGGKNFIVKRLKRDANLLYEELTLFGPE